MASAPTGFVPRLAAACAVAALHCACPPVRAGEGEDTWRVGFVSFGDGLEEEHRGCANGFVAALARKGLSSRLHGSPGSGAWHRTPDGVPPGRWLLLAAVRMGPHIELLALRPRPADGGITLVARQPADATAYPGLPWTKRPAFGPAQDLRLAIDYLATQTARALSGPGPDPESIAVRVSVASSERLGDAPVPGIEVVAVAAASRAGLRTTLVDAPHGVTVSAARRDVFYEVQVAWQDGERRRAFECGRIPGGGLFDILCASVRSVMSADNACEDLRYVSPAPTRLFGFRDDVLLFESEKRVRTLELGNGVLSWLTPVVEHGRPVRAARVSADDGMALYEYAPRLERISLREGGAAAPVGPPSSDPWGFRFDEKTGWLAVVEGRTLSLCENGAPLWTHRAATRITCGPLIAGDRLVIGEESGALHALSLAGEEEVLWSATVGGRLYGAPTRAGGPRDALLVASREGSLAAVSASDGTVLWRVELGDRIVGKPAVIGGMVAVASGLGGVLLLDRETGAVRERRTFPHALRHFVAFEAEDRCLACADVSGRVTFLSGRDLAVVRTLSLGGPLVDLVAVQGAPLTRLSGDDMRVYSDHLVLACDGSGVLTFLPVPVNPSSSEGAP